MDTEESNLKHNGIPKTSPRTEYSITNALKSAIDKINYLVALISEFAKAHQLSTQAAYLYLNQFKGLNFADEFYDVNHTLSFDNVVEDLTLYCKKNGGQLA